MSREGAFRRCTLVVISIMSHQGRAMLTLPMRQAWHRATLARRKTATTTATISIHTTSRKNARCLHSRQLLRPTAQRHCHPHGKACHHSCRNRRTLSSFGRFHDSASPPSAAATVLHSIASPGSSDMILQGEEQTLSRRETGRSSSSSPTVAVVAATTGGSYVSAGTFNSSPDSPSSGGDDPMRPRPILLRCLRKVPDEPGVYVMLSGKGRTLYIGKSVMLSSRVPSYFSFADGGGGVGDGAAVVLPGSNLSRRISVMTTLVERWACGCILRVLCVYLLFTRLLDMVHEQSRCAGGVGG